MFLHAPKLWIQWRQPSPRPSDNWREIKFFYFTFKGRQVYVETLSETIKSTEYPCPPSPHRSTLSQHARNHNFGLVYLSLGLYSTFLYTKTPNFSTQHTGRPLSKVLPCPNKGSRSCFVNVPQRRYHIFNVHRPGTLHVQTVYSLYTASLRP